MGVAESLGVERSIFCRCDSSHQFLQPTSNPLNGGIMNRHRQSATWLGATLGTLCALLFLALSAHASDHRGDQTEEFHQTYTISAEGRVELDNINGDVHITSWDRNEVKVDAVKYADTKERLDEAKIEVDSGKDYVSN